MRDGKFGFGLVGASTISRERMIAAHQTQIEVDEPEEDAMALLMGAEMDRPAPTT